MTRGSLPARWFDEPMAIFEGFSLEDVRLADDVVPIVEVLERVDAHFAEERWHWFFFASDQAERVITADPMAWYRLDPAETGQESYDDTVSAVNDPRVVRAMLEDYRAGLHVDRAAERATGPPDAGSPARPSSPGPAATTWSASTATRPRSGARGARSNRSPASSSRGTTWPRRTPRRWRRCSVASSPARQRPVTPGSDAQDPDNPPRNIPKRITEASGNPDLGWGRSLAR